MEGLMRSLSLSAMLQACLRKDQPREKDCMMYSPVRSMLLRVFEKQSRVNRADCFGRKNAALTMTCSKSIIANLWGLLQPANLSANFRQAFLSTSQQDHFHAGRSASDRRRRPWRRNRERDRSLRFACLVIHSTSQPSCAPPPPPELDYCGEIPASPTAKREDIP